MYSTIAPYLPWVYWLLLAAVHLLGWFLNLLGLPGLWLMVLAHVAFALLTGWNNYVGWPSLIALFSIAVLAEIVEFLAGAAGSAQAGGSKRGMLGAILGGLAGGIVGSIFIPVPIAGTIIGAVGGSFAGTALIEHLIEADTDRAIRIGIGAAKGRLMGIISKSVFGALMIVISLVVACPLFGGKPPTMPLPGLTTAPTISPATTQAHP